MMTFVVQGKHVLVYDNCSVHQSTMRSQAPRPTSSRTSKTTSALRTTDVDPKEYDDLPPLSAFDDDEDDDARIFSRFQRESNSWLLFVRNFASYLCRGAH